MCTGAGAYSAYGELVIAPSYGVLFSDIDRTFLEEVVVKIAFTCIVAIALALAVMQASAQNLVSNGNFDTDLNGWSVGFSNVGTPAWFGDDCCGNAGSGSARLLALHFPTSLNSSCIAVTGGNSYDLVVMANTLPAGGTILTGAEADILWFGDASCSQEMTRAVGVNVGNSAGWRQVGATIVAPDNVMSARIELFAGGGGLSSGIDAYFDNVRFGPPGSVPVTLQSFDVE